MMTTARDTLPGFLLACIEEDERESTSLLDMYGGTGPGLPQRVLAECASKRKLIELAYADAARVDGEWGCCHSVESLRLSFGRLPDDCYGRTTLMDWFAALALSYADRPGYREEWRP
jgi:hypothetical protein